MFLRDKVNLFEKNGTAVTRRVDYTYDNEVTKNYSGLFFWAVYSADRPKNSV